MAAVAESKAPALFGSVNSRPKINEARQMRSTLAPVWVDARPKVRRTRRDGASGFASAQHGRPAEATPHARNLRHHAGHTTTRMQDAPCVPSSGVRNMPRRPRVLSAARARQASRAGAAPARARPNSPDAVPDGRNPRRDGTAKRARRRAKVTRSVGARGGRRRRRGRGAALRRRGDGRARRRADAAVDRIRVRRRRRRAPT